MPAVLQVPDVQAEGSYSTFPEGIFRLEFRRTKFVHSKAEPGMVEMYALLHNHVRAACW